MSQMPPPPNDNPYAAPQGGPGDIQPGSAEIRQRVSAPSIALMVVAGIGIALQAVSMIINLMSAGVGAAAAQNQQEQLAQMAGGTFGLVFGAIGLAVGGLIFYGAMQMRNLQSYGLSMAASILAMIPCISPCCLLGLPIGIWCLVVLNDAQVKRGFLS